MRAEKVEKLSFLVTSILEELAELKLENQRLHEMIEELVRKNQDAAALHERTRKDLGLLNSLQEKNQKMEQEQSRIRSKVQTVLKDLEQMEFS